MKSERLDSDLPASRRLLYVLAGIGLAAGAPLGLLVLRALVAGNRLTLAWVEHEFVADPVLYLYQGLASAAVFGAAAFVLGRFEEHLERLSAQDPLTELIARAVRYRKPLSFLLIDVDDFKHINDSYGHTAGDTALRGIAECLRASCRSSDTPARYGGDEFAVLLTETNLEDAERFAERLLSLMRRATSYAPGVKPPTLSIGIAELQDTDAAEARQLIRRADGALYAAKCEGRDRVSVAAPPRVAPSSISRSA
jgi:diguanylate cyclase (GGDEF)-like protein